LNSGHLIIFSFFIAFGGNVLKAQVQISIKGKVYDKEFMQPLASVSVLSTSGKGTATDSLGNYTLSISPTDSIWFSYLNKPTIRYPASTISNKEAFDIALHIPVSALKEINILPRHYTTDSLQNRANYARIFNYKKPTFAITAPASGGLGVGLDLDQLIGMFQFGKNRRMIAFQQRLIREEQDKYVDHRFTKLLVKKITSLSGQKLESFMLHIRPSYEFVQNATDYELAAYIKRNWIAFR
jgi:hypothetical protein